MHSFMKLNYICVTCVRLYYILFSMNTMIEAYILLPQVVPYSCLVETFPLLQEVCHIIWSLLQLPILYQVFNTLKIHRQKQAHQFQSLKQQPHYKKHELSFNTSNILPNFILILVQLHPPYSYQCQCMQGNTHFRYILHFLFMLFVKYLILTVKYQLNIYAIITVQSKQLKIYQ